MKNAFIFLLLFATLLPTVSPWGTIAYYHVNKEYITRVLCENRDKPQLHCDGQCFLAKKLKAQQERQNKETARRLRGVPTIHLFCPTAWTYSFASSALTVFVRQLPAYLIIGYRAPLTAIFQPPRFQ